MTKATQRQYDCLSYQQLLEEREALFNRISLLDSLIDQGYYSQYAKEKATKELNHLAPCLRYVTSLIHKLNYIQRAASLTERP